jgi:hypothetical protein
VSAQANEFLFLLDLLEASFDCGRHFTEPGIQNVECGPDPAGPRKLFTDLLNEWRLDHGLLTSQDIQPPGLVEVEPGEHLGDGQ